MEFKSIEEAVACFAHYHYCYELLLFARETPEESMEQLMDKQARVLSSYGNLIGVKTMQDAFDHLSTIH